MDLGKLFPDVSRETLGKLGVYADLLCKWNKAINLVAPDSINDLWQRHFADSLQLLAHIPCSARSLIDIGTGAGFPGLVLAVAAHDGAQPLKVTLLDSDQRKCEFLRTVAREVGVDVKIVSERAGTTKKPLYDVMTARAFAPLEEVLRLADTCCKADGTILLLKGESHAAEVGSAQHIWRFRLQTWPSLTNPDARILEIGELSRV